MEVSPLRNLTRNFLKYSLYFSDLQTEYKFVDFEPSLRLSAGTVEITVEGNPFSGESESVKSIILKPNNFETEKAFKDPFDEVEDFLLNRLVTPKYTSKFEIIRETDSGSFYKANESVTWALDGFWNLDIRTNKFESYLNKLNLIADDLDDYKSNLITRFLTSGSLRDFDINSVNYTVKDDIPSQLLKNLAETVGWDPNVSMITKDNFLESIFGNGKNSLYTGQSVDKTPTEIDYQYYRNLILNSAYLFKSKGTRRSIEALMRMIGAPEALIDFNEIIYLADGPINVNKFDNQFASITGGTKSEELPVLDPNITFSISGVTYTGFTTQTVLTNVDTIRSDYPVDGKGYPKAPTPTDEMFFEKGAGWYEQTPAHRAPEILDRETIFR
jgi:hypothetical protein